MMRRLLTVSFLAMLFLPAMVLAQTSMQGEVTDASTGATVPGAAVSAQQYSMSSTQNKLNVGIKAGVNLATLRGKLVKNVGFRPALTFGGFLTYYFNESFAIQPEADFTMAGAKGGFSLYHYAADGFNRSDFKYKSIKTAYLQLPILFKYAFSNSGGFQPSIFAGPSLNYNLAHSYTPDGNSLFPQPQVSGVGSSIVAGLSARVGSFLIDARYDYGLTKAFNVMDATNVGIAFTVGYIF